MSKRLLVPLFVACILCSLPARSQLVVTDIGNLIQSILQAINQIEQIEHQIKSLEHEAESLVNEASNLKGLNFNVLSQLKATTAAITDLVNKAEGIAYGVSASLQAFNDNYPKAYSSNTTNAKLALDTLNRWNNSLAALRTTVQVQSQATENFAKDQDALTDLIGQSQSAEGALEAAQVTNQLLALHARQMIQDQQLRIAQDRAMALEHARAIAAEEKARNVRSRFMTGSSHYTPEPVQ